MLPGRSAGELLVEAGRRARGLSSFALQRFVLGRRFVQRRVYDYELLLDARDPGISAQLIRLGQRELEQKAIVERVLTPGMTAFDLGANIGYYTVMMARIVGRTGRVYAVEPHATNFDLLKRNVARNGINAWTDLQQVAIARESGRQPLWVMDHSNWHSFCRPEVAHLGWAHRYRRNVLHSIDVETVSLGDYLAGKRPIDFLRMDLEGYEVQILKSLAEQRASRPQVLFETHPEFYGPANDLRPVLEELCTRQGYGVRYLVSDFHFGWREQPDVEPGQAVFQRYGYGADHIEAQFRNRAIYSNLRTADAIDLIVEREQVNAALLAPVETAPTRAGP